MTFLNKFDRPGREPLELLDEIEKQIGLRPTPATWPVGLPGEFRGVIDRRTGRFTRFTRTTRGSAIAPEEEIDAERAAAEEGSAWTRGGRRVRPARRDRGRRRPEVVPGRRVDTGVRRLGAHQLRCAPPARRDRRPRAARRARASTSTASRGRSTRLLGVRLQGAGQHGPRRTATGSRSCGSVRDASSGGWC